MGNPIRFLWLAAIKAEVLSLCTPAISFCSCQIVLPPQPRRTEHDHQRLGCYQLGRFSDKRTRTESQLWLRSALVSERVTTVTFQCCAGEHEPRL